jgi:cytochrome c-type biogenesis protein CcmH
MRSLFFPLFALALTLAAATAPASTLAEYRFDNPADELVFRQLIEELRCLVCQNESLAGSQAELAQDLRREVYEMMLAGKTKDQIIQFLVARYGDFVLYNPPLKPTTYPLWFGPFLLVGVGGFFLARTLLRRRRGGETTLSAEEQTRLQSLLASRSQSGDQPR